MSKEKIERHFSGLQAIKREASGETPATRRITGRAVVFNEATTLYEDNDMIVREIISPSAMNEELLSKSDIRMTMYHNREKLLARSKRGEGTLEYAVTESGVDFGFDVLDNIDGERAYSLVENGVIDGCSFIAFVDYSDPAAVERQVQMVENRRQITYTIRAFMTVEDFTLTDRPAYDTTSCAVAREKAQQKPAVNAAAEKQIAEIAATCEFLKKGIDNF